MVRATIFLLVLVYAGMEPAHAQIFNRGGEPKDRGEPIFTPLKNLRERAASGAPAVIAEKAKEACASCKLKGKLFPEAACKRCQAQKEKEAEEEKDEKAKEAELKKLEAEAKKAELEAKKLEEDDKKRNKPWDIADEENLELKNGEEPHLLALAAAAKIEQDLSPKKQQALDYLASLGCNKDPKVTKAILAGLKDFNVEVRKTAVQAVIYAVQGPNGLQYQADPFQAQPFYSEPVYSEPVYSEPVYSQPGIMGGFGSTETPNGTVTASYQDDAPPAPEDDCPACKIAEKKKLAKENRKQQRKTRRLTRQQGPCNNCGNLNGACGCGNVVYGTPASDCGCQECGEGHDSCISCCAPEIRKELQKMAFDPDPKRPGCYYEPSAEVRNLALQAYNICPPQPEQKDEKDPEVKDKKGVSEGKGGEDDQQGVSEGSGVDEPMNLLNTESDEDAGGPEPDEVDPEVPDADSDDSVEGDALFYSPASQFQGAKSSMLRGRVSRYINAGYEIQYSSEFQIPAGNLLYIETDRNAHTVEVVSSSPGFAAVKQVDGRFAGKTSSIRIGIMR